MYKEHPLLNKKRKSLSIYYTAGYPTVESTIQIAEALEKCGVDFLEIGFPYSDPVADGPTIQRSSEIALQNGMSLKLLFQQLKKLRTKVSIPAFLMGYFNPVLQFGVDEFCKACKESGINGVIIPDLPMYVYEEEYKPIFEKYGISFIFLVTPQTSEDRIRKIDGLSTSFIYLLSSNSTTGNNLDIDQQAKDYFKRIEDMKLKSPIVVGFGISNKHTFISTTEYADGAIIGSAFVKLLDTKDYMSKIPEFIHSILD